MERFLQQMLRKHHLSVRLSATRRWVSPLQLHLRQTIVTRLVLQQV